MAVFALLTQRLPPVMRRSQVRRGFLHPTVERKITKTIPPKRSCDTEEVRCFLVYYARAHKKNDVWNEGYLKWFAKKQSTLHRLDGKRVTEEVMCVFESKQRVKQIAVDFDSEQEYLLERFKITLEEEITLEEVERVFAHQGALRPHRLAQRMSSLDPLPSKGVGYDLLLKMGWKEGEGLGKTGTGMREPVPVRMRASTSGLGSV